MTEAKQYDDLEQRDGETALLYRSRLLIFRSSKDSYTKDELTEVYR
ncbi:MAG: hypothetical protein NC078_05395 [Ruminococcus sp.]|nr:hypothetical protein [Ruminococcus sp.]